MYIQYLNPFLDFWFDPIDSKVLICINLLMKNLIFLLDALSTQKVQFDAEYMHAWMMVLIMNGFLFSNANSR